MGACVLVQALALSPSADACGHPLGGASLGPPRMVRPLPGAVDVPTNVEVVIHWIDCCLDADDPTLAARMFVRRPGETTDVPGVVTLEQTWGTPWTVTARPARFVADGGFAPVTTYEVWAVMPDNWSNVERMVATFTTGAGPADGPPPAAPVVTATVAPSASCTDWPELACCGDTPVQLVELAGTDPALLYTLSTPDGLIAVDAPAPVRGLVSCGSSASIEGTYDLDYTPWWLSTPDPATSFALSVVARDALGRESPATTITFEATCAPGGGDPDAGVGGDDESGGCSAGGNHTADSGAVVLALATIVTYAARRRATPRAKSQA